MERLIRRFEQAHLRGDRPQIDDYLRAEDAEQPTLLLVELVHVDLELRMKSRENVSVEEYLARYPALRQAEPVVLSLIQTERHFRRHLGEPTELTSYCDRFPELAGQLQMGLASWPSSSATGTVRSDLASSVGFTFSDPPLFASLPRSARRLLEALLVERHFAPGEYLLRQGAAASSLTILLEGTAEIVAQDEAGHAFRVGVAGPQDILGEMALLTDEPCSADVVATTPVKATILSAAAFHALAFRYPVFVEVLTQIVASRLGTQVRDVLAGKQLGGYRIRQRAGRGGMAIVYEAEDIQSGRHVALKMMSHRLVYNSEALRLFQREAALIEAFDHPRIIRMYGRFEAFRTYFIVLEFAEGSTLAELLKSDFEFEAGHTRRILGQLAEAIAYAHSRQVLHRDIKPSNIMLEPDGNAKLMDFGLATPLGEPTTAGSPLVVGTPGYMAPEQAAGAALTVAADYFSLGCVAYELCTGRRLFRGNDLADIERRRSRWTAKPFGELCPHVEPTLAAALENCLHPDPERRTLDLEALSRCAPSREQTV
ncbi:MAG TPA: protein kinase [Pirellulales bacterium]|nr:protein kinase [Pirellulales bacterium]